MLSPATRAAVLEVVRRLRDPMLDMRTDSLGAMLSRVSDSTLPDAELFRDVRGALGLNPREAGSLARWARGKSREEVAQALEEIAREEA